MGTHDESQSRESIKLPSNSSHKPESDVREKATTRPILQILGGRKPKVKEKGDKSEVFVEGRKSVSDVETNVASVAAFLQVKVMSADMPDLMQVHAIRCARRTYNSFNKFSSRQMAYNLKK
ncbi:dynein light chain type 1 family protein isoform X2 [Tasmannia lanceolata]